MQHRTTIARKYTHAATALWIVLFLFISSWSGAQTISHAEYFFDVDPGTGKGIPLSISAGDPVSFTETITTTGLQPGSHQLFVRTKTSNGVWSLYEPREFIIDAGIQGAEYFFDTDPGIGKGTPLAVPLNPGSFTTTIPTASLPDGEHFLFIRTRHNNNIWSLMDPQPFYIQTRIVSAEYFIDTDPGFGKGSPLVVSTPSDLVTLATSITTPLLPNGDHYLFVRTKDIHGQWSHFEPQLFQVDAILPIKLLNFTAIPDEQHVTLKWTTVNEINNAYFVVEHSTTGTVFDEIFQVPGAGTSVQSIQYEKKHRDPAQGLNYYRLKQIDFNGSMSYSDVVSAFISLPNLASVYPNPIIDTWFIQFGSDDQSSSRLLELYDLTGRKLAAYTTNEQRKIELSREGILPGTYLLHIISSDKIELHKICFR